MEARRIWEMLLRGVLEAFEGEGCCGLGCLGGSSMTMIGVSTVRNSVMRKPPVIHD